MAKLTKADEVCVRAHSVEGLSKTDAYRKAFNKRVVRWKPETINNKAYQFFKRGEIQARLEQISEEAREDTKIDHAYVLRRFKELESFNFKDLYDAQGHFKSVCDWPDALAQTIIGIEVESLFEGRGKDREMVGTVTKIKIESRSKALESIAKHLKFYPDANVTLNADEDLIEFFEKVSNAPLGSVQGRLANNANKKRHVN